MLSYNIFMSFWNFRLSSMQITSSYALFKIYAVVDDWLPISLQWGSYSSYGYHFRYPFTTFHAKTIFWMILKGKLVIYSIHDLDQILNHPRHYAWLSLTILQDYSGDHLWSCQEGLPYKFIFVECKISWISWGVLIHKKLCILF